MKNLVLSALLFLFLLPATIANAGPNSVHTLKPTERLWHFLWGLDMSVIAHGKRIDGLGYTFVKRDDWKPGDNFIAFKKEDLEFQINREQTRKDWHLTLYFALENQDQLSVIRQQLEKSFNEFSNSGFEFKVAPSEVVFEKLGNYRTVEILFRAQEEMSPHHFAKRALTFLKHIEPVAKVALNSSDKACDLILNPNNKVWPGWALPTQMGRVDPNKFLF